MAWTERTYDDGGGRTPPKMIFRMPSWLTFVLLATLLGVFLLQAITGGGIAGASPITHWGYFTYAGYWAVKQPWRWFTYSYVHVDGVVLFFNLISIYFLIPALEAMVGWKRTLTIYTAGALAGAVTFGLMSLVSHGLPGLVSATGATLSVLGALAAFDPDGQVMAMMIIPVTWRILAILYGILLVLLVVGNHDYESMAHLGGLAFGWGGCLLYKKYGDRIKYDFDTKRQQKARLAVQDEQREIDRILQKVSDQGMHKLTRGEKKTLQRATDRQRTRDAELAKRYR